MESDTENCPSKTIAITYTGDSDPNSSEMREFREKFYKLLSEFYASQSAQKIKKPWSQQKISEVMIQIKSAKVAMSSGVRRTPGEYYWTSKYDVIQVGGQEHLIWRKSTPGDPTIRIVPMENYFDLLLQVHEECGHGGRDKMKTIIKDKYHVGIKAITTFVSLCPICENRRNYPQKGKFASRHWAQARGASSSDKNKSNISNHSLDGSQRNVVQRNHESPILGENEVIVEMVEQNSIQDERNKSHTPQPQRCAVKRKFTERENVPDTSFDHVDRNLSFFKSLLPSLALLNDDQTLEFHSGVISLLQNIKSKRSNAEYNWATPQTSGNAITYQYQEYHGETLTDSVESPSPNSCQETKFSEDPLHLQKQKFK